MMDAPHGLMLHHFRGGPHPEGQGAITATEFAEMLQFLGPDRFLTPEIWCQRAEAGKLAPGDLCLTFDDALKCQFDIALPVLREFGLKAFWFVYSGVFHGRAERLEIYRHFRSVRFSSVEAFYSSFLDRVSKSVDGDSYRSAMETFKPCEYLVDYSFYTEGDRRFRFVRDRVLGPERYEALMDSMINSDPDYTIENAMQQLWMTDDDLRRLADEGHEIGLHSFSHPTRMADLPIESQAQQYRANSDHLDAVLGRRPRSMSHPCNSYGPETLTLLADLGIRIGFRSNLADVAGGLLEMPRDDHSHVAARMGMRRAA